MKIAVHLHLYYMEQLPVWLGSLQNLDTAVADWDLYVTMPPSHTEAEMQIRRLFPDAAIWYPENRGYDIGPFIDFLHRINLDEYDYVLKLHTKNQKQGNYTILNGNRMDNALWSRVMREALLGSPQQVSRNISQLENNPHIGMLASKYCLTSEPQTYAKLLSAINAAMANMSLPAVKKLSFAAGSMFMVRAKLLKPFLAFSVTDFLPTDGRVKEGTLAHALERAFGATVQTQGFEVSGIAHGNYTFRFMAARAQRFLYQKKITRKGKTIIKICKIPLHLN